MIEILYEDGEALVIDKPAGLVSHPRLSAGGPAGAAGAQVFGALSVSDLATARHTANQTRTTSIGNATRDLRQGEATQQAQRDIALATAVHDQAIAELTAYGAVIDDLASHPEFGRRLFWFDSAGDVDLAFAYDHCAAALAPSYAEGFGLPIAEAAWRGKPALCSDIPVFREIGGEGALYFRVNDAAALARLARDFLEGRTVADPARVVRPTWREAGLRIFDVVVRNQWMRTLP